jgi:dTDP-4-amino-4,6-dideoxygalactose transaminase
VADEAVRQALERAYRDGDWGRYQGSGVIQLERRLCETFAVAFAIAVGSGTYAVELALRALRVQANDEVLLPAYDYPGNFLSVHALGAVPVLLDVRAEDRSINPELLSLATSSQAKAIVASHLHGGMADLERIREFAQSRGLAVLEDAAQAAGATVAGRPAGSLGDVAVLSFGGSKLLTAGRGGAILTRRADVYHRARAFLSRCNVVCPLSELQAAVLIPQLDRLPERHQQRREAVAFLERDLAAIPGLTRFRPSTPNSDPAFYKVGWHYEEAAFGLPRSRLAAALRAEGIACDQGFPALHVGRSPSRFRRACDLPEATKAHVQTLVLHHPVLLGSRDDLADVGRAWRKIAAHVDQVRDAPGPNFKNGAF